MNLESKNTLVHYGTKGMRWGVRRDKINASSSKTQNGDEAKSAKQVKLEKEQDLLRRVGSTSPSPKDIDLYIELDKKIREKSGNVYDSDPVSEAFKNAMGNTSKKWEEFQKTTYKTILTRKPPFFKPEIDKEKQDRVNQAYHKALAEFKKSRLEWAGAVLKDIGFEDNDLSREYMGEIIFAD